MKRVWVFLAVTFGLTWGLLIPAGIVLGTFEHGETSSATMFALIAVSMFFPLAGALVANFTGPLEGRIDLGFQPFVKRNAKAYLAAWFTPAVLALLGCIVFFALNPQWFDPTMDSYLEVAAISAGVPVDQIPEPPMPIPALVGLSVVAALTVAPFMNMIPAFGEELGWRGMLFPALSEHLSPRAAALVSGVIWGLWHAPAIAMGHNYGMGYAGFPFAGIATMILSCTALGCWLAYLRMRSGSVWPCALAHGAFNAVANIGVVFCTVGQGLLGPSPLGLVAGIPVFALGAVCLFRLPAGKPGTR